ncbi:GAF domain-containing protein [Streptomyces sp. NBC_00370]|uniref:GAF domain-containing protein n=1 Tax=Streptomyces sp. NBC_00370 TaxID=2975728 RepID=UPI002E268302
MSRQQQISEAFVSLTDTFAPGVDPLVLVDRLVDHCVRLTGADAAGIMMVTARAGLRTMAVSDERADLLEIFQLQTGEGPCVDCLRDGRPVDAADLAEHGDRWPGFVPLARAAGFRSAHAVPVRVNSQVIGALNLLGAAPRALCDDDLRLAGALADVTAVALMQWEAEPVRPQDVLTLVQAVISAKATLETAKGMLAADGLLTPAEAAAALRAYSSRQGRRPSEIAQELVHRTLDPAAVITSRAAVVTSQEEPRTPDAT